jgi:alpha-galactosidase
MQMRKREMIMRNIFVLAVILLTALSTQVRAEKVAKGPVKLFILAGQSNMEGKALATSLDAVIADPKARDNFKHLKTDGKWTVRNDVWVTYLDKSIRGTSNIPLYGPLTIGFGGHKTTGKPRREAPTVGPELGIGHVLGDHYDQQVLLIKAAWGGKSVKRNFRPPSAMPTDEQLKEELETIKKKNPDMTFAELKESYGMYYRKILEETRKVTGNIKKYFPDYDQSQGCQLAGLIWFQGWNDGVGKGNPDYTEQTAQLIRDLRKDLNTPSLPVVIGELGTDGPNATGWIATFRAQQAEIAAIDEFKDNVRLAKTAQYWPTYPNTDDKWQAFRIEAKKNEQKPQNDPTRIKPGDYYQANWVQRHAKELSYFSDKRYHYKGSGACYYQMGEAMAKAMLQIAK